MASTPRWRVLACVIAPENVSSGVSVFSTLLDLATPDRQPKSAQVSVLYRPSLVEFKDAVATHQPNVIYCCGSQSQLENQQPGTIGSFHFQDHPVAGDTVLLAALAETKAELVYVDAVVSPHFGPALHHRGIPHVVIWPASGPIPALVASTFNAVFMAFLTSAGASPPEAFAAASQAAQAHCGGGGGAGGQQDGGGAAVALPAFVSAVRPTLPDSGSIPPLIAPGLAVDPASLPSFPGWCDVRLLAPRAEVRLLLCGGSSLIDSTRLSFLGEALRALLIMEARALTLVSRTPLEQLPRNLAPSCRAVRCGFTSSTGAPGSVVLGAPESVLEREELVQHALRMTLVTDSVSLQFRLPPPGLSLPTARSSPAVAGGVAVVDTVAVTSVWAVEVLRQLCREPKCRTLAALGVAAVGNMADTAFSPGDVARLTLLVAGSAGAGTAPPPPPPHLSGTASEPAPAAPPPAGEALPSPAAPPAAGGEAAGTDAPDLSAAAASGTAYYGNDALMGYALGGHLQTLGTAADGAAASPDSADAAGAGGGAGARGSDGAYGAMDGWSPDGPGADGGGAGSRAASRPAGPLSERRPNFTGDLPGYTCRRPSLASCTEAQFYDDLVQFLTLLRGKPIDRARFPEAVLNGVSLDLFSLYREVVTRGGFRVGNGINWKGQVFPRMRNWTETNKQTGVGNALKRHYQNYLWEYEVAHPEDVTLDRCVLCNGGDAVSSDWVCCDTCENWAHFSCDKRPGIGTFKDYAQGQGRVYVCPSCAREAEAGEAVKRQRTA